MKFSESWLRTFVDPPLSTRELADKITFGGIEVEAIEPVAPPFERVVVGEVLSVAKHPGADRLSVCQVNVGVAPLSVVCGAPGVRAGMRVPVALVGARLPGMEIKSTAVRGVESSGMLCSAKELGIADSASGLLELPPGTAIGADVRAVLDLDDRIFTVKPTPNRGDCLSVLGMAREVAALCARELRVPELAAVVPAVAESISVTLETDKCPLYCGRLIRDVDGAVATPSWIASRLARSGIRTISVVVDITNYVMLELGQPLHAFDATKLSGGIRVRRARDGETLAVLNGESPRLDDSCLVIADDRKPLALAGIMGGAESAVTGSTRDLFIESAYFEADAIAGKSRSLGFGSDSSYRFERGVDFGLTAAALERATRLILDTCGGKAGPVTTARTSLPRRNPVSLRMARLARVLGVPFDRHDACAILTRLGFSVDATAEGCSAVPPTHRFDIAIEEDLIEEVARVHGYDRIPASMPPVSGTMLPVPEGERPAPAIRQALAARDYQEIVAYSFVDRMWEEDFCANSDPIALANPIASQMSVMRSHLFGGLVGALAFNAHHKQTRVRLFEVGRCFTRSGTDYEQPLRVGAIAFGDAAPLQWGVAARDVDFYDVKADIEILCGSRTLSFERAPCAAFHPGKSARIMDNARPVGWIGELHPRWQQKYDLPRPAILFELEFDFLACAIVPKFSEISRYPPVRRDMTAEFDESIEFATVLAALQARKPAIVAEIGLLDIYRGPGVDKGKKSLAFRVLLQDTHKTLTDAEVESAVSQLRQTLLQQFNAKLR